MHLPTVTRLLTVAACTLAAPMVARAATAAVPQTAPASLALSAAQIVGVLNATAAADAASAGLAADATHNIRIQGYAGDVLRDSTTLQKAVANYTALHQAAAEDSPARQAISQRAARDLDDLQGTYGQPFDHRYLEQQIVGQGDVLAHLNRALADAAGDRDLAALLTSARTQVARHLLFAQQLRGDLER